MRPIEHIAILTPGFPPPQGDSLCIPPLQAYLRTLQQQKSHCKISVLAFQYPFKKGPYEWNGIQVWSAGGRNKWMRKPWTWAHVRKAFHRLHRTQPVDVIHSLWLQEATLQGQRLAARYGCTHVATVQGQDALGSNRYLRHIDFDKVRVVALSERAAQEFQRNTGRKADARIPWGLCAEEFALPEEGRDRPIDLLGVGSLIPLKKFDRFLRVVQRVAEHKPDVRAVLIGDGPERNHLHALAQELGIVQHVEFAGSQPREAVLEHMAKAKVLLHPAMYEGQGYVFLEALASGMHIVSSPVGIAEASDKWAVCAHTVGQAEEVLRFLRTPLDLHARIPHTMESTLQAYFDLYAGD